MQIIIPVDLNHDGNSTLALSLSEGREAITCDNLQFV